MAVGELCIDDLGFTVGTFVLPFTDAATFAIAPGTALSFSYAITLVL